MTAPAWTVAAAYAAMGLILAGSARRHRPRTVPGLPDDGKGCMSEEEFLDFLIIVLKADEAAAEPERSA